MKGERNMNNIIANTNVSRRSVLAGLAGLGITGAVVSITGCSSDGGSGAGGNVLNISLASSPSNLDPCRYTGVYESQVIGCVCDTLVTYNMDLTEIVGCLATDWTVSDDGLTYTFTLRDDVKFQPGEYQDGRTMTAEDVKYSLERSHAESAAQRLTMLDHCNVIDDTHIECVLPTPNAAFLTALTDTGNSIVPQEEVEGWGDSFGDHLIGTGPFKLDEFARDQQSTLSRFDDYWGETAKLDGVVWKVIEDTTQAANALFTGDVDMVTDLTGESLQTVKADSNYVVEDTEGLHVTYFYMNNVSGPTADQRVRKAILMSVKREDLVAAAYPYGGGSEACLPLPKGSWGYDAAVEEIVPAYDPEGAKALLAEAGYADGCSLTYYTSSTTTGVDVGTIVQQQLKENLNIDMEIQTLDWGAFSEITAAGECDIFAMSWTWYPDPYFFLNNLFSSDNLGSQGNGAGFSHPEVDELLKQAVLATDQEERAAIYKQALRKIVEYDPIYVYGSANVTTGMTPNVEGYVQRADKTVKIVGPNVNVSKTA